MVEAIRVLVCESPGVLQYAKQKKPVYGKGEALVRIHKVGICGTDLHAFEGVQPYFQYPRILGHELGAEFIDGDGVGFHPGDRVSILPYFNCNSCIACRNGKPNCCVNMKVCGVHQDGGMVEYLVVPFSSLIHGQGLSFNELALVEPMAIGTHALKRAAVQPNEFVLVIGAGPIGLGIMEVAGLLGARVIAMDVNDSRLEFCRRQLKIEYTINPLKTDARAQLVDITSGDMPTLVVDATGNLKAITESFTYMAHGGRYVLVGLQKDEISFSHPEFHKREGTLMSSRNATKEDFDFVIRNISAGRINVNKFITHTISFETIRDEFSSLLDVGRGVVKAVINMTEAR
jgi:2-desacetyl-2-hydroxyethyl bacteriochlorophyllide A dehydrogenase